MLTIGYCTRETDENHPKHLIKTCGLNPKKIQIIEIVNKGDRSLTECYNEILNKSIYNHIVFCHNDITIDTKQWGDKLLNAFDRHSDYGIIGVAGSKYMPTSGKWWENPKKMYGRVKHTHEGKSWLSSYSEDQGHDIEEVINVDGLFFAIDKTKIKATFNESVEGFHFYDVTFCIENYLQKVKIGVITTIRVNHMSIGKTNEQWENNRINFATNNKDNLPLNIQKILRKGQKLKVLIACLNFVGETQEERYILDLIKKLKDENCDIALCANIDKKQEKILNLMGVKTFSLQQPPGFKLGDGQWKLKTINGDIDSQPNVLYKVSDVKFDILHINKKPVADHILRLYPDINAINTIHTTDKTMDEPIISAQIKKYISITDEIKEILIEGYRIDSNIIVNENANIMDEYKLILA